MAKTRIAPVHPGVYLKELLEELELSQYRPAHDIGVARYACQSHRTWEATGHS